MNELWNNKCILIATDGNVYHSGFSKNHNESISECAKNINFDIDPLQSMVSMIDVLVKKNNILLLNAGYVEVENTKKRTGYLALPDTITEKQIVNCETLKLLLEEYESMTVWQIQNDKLKVISMGKTEYVEDIIQKLIANALKNEVNYESKI